MLRHLVVRDLAPAERGHVVRAERGALMRHDPGADLLAEPPVRDAEHLRLPDVGMAEEVILDLARIDVLAAADDHVLHTPDDAAEAVLVKRRQVAGMHPSVDNALAGPLTVAPVAAHHGIAART